MLSVGAIRMALFQTFLIQNYFLSYFQQCIRQKSNSIEALENQCSEKLGRQPTHLELVQSGLLDNFYRDVLLSGNNENSSHFNTVKKYSVCHLKAAMTDNALVKRRLSGSTVGRISNVSIAFPTRWLIKSVSNKNLNAHFGTFHKL